MSARDVMVDLLAQWDEARQTLSAIEEAEHPDLTDKFGRAWAWKDKDLYTHDGMAWPVSFVQSQGIGLPTEHALNNPNYQWCSICKPTVDGADLASAHPEMYGPFGTHRLVVLSTEDGAR